MARIASLDANGLNRYFESGVESGWLYFRGVNLGYYEGTANITVDRDILEAFGSQAGTKKIGSYVTGEEMVMAVTLTVPSWDLRELLSNNFEMSADGQMVLKSASWSKNRSGALKVVRQINGGISENDVLCLYDVEIEVEGDLFKIGNEIQNMQLNILIRSKRMANGQSSYGFISTQGDEPPIGFDPLEWVALPTSLVANEDSITVSYEAPVRVLRNARAVIFQDEGDDVWVARPALVSASGSTLVVTPVDDTIDLSLSNKLYLNDRALRVGTQYSAMIPSLPVDIEEVVVTPPEPVQMSGRGRKAVAEEVSE